MIHTLCLIAVVGLGAEKLEGDLSFDRFGGWKDVRFGPGRFFRTHFDGRRWWLVTPEGHAFISIGACVVGPQGSFIRGTDRFPYREHVLAKHGNIETWAKVTRERLGKWGFNTLACWSGGEVRDVPRTDTLGFAGGGENWLKGGMPDFFDPGFVENAKKVAKTCRHRRDDPWLIGWFLDNELAWDRDWRFAPPLFDRYAELPADAPGKKAWCKVLQEHHKTVEGFNRVWRPSIESWSDLEGLKRVAPLPGQDDAAKADRDAFTLTAARQYFRVATEAIRAEDPHHLILGCRLVSWVAPKMVVKACGEFCDVISVNHYELGPVGELAYNRWAKDSTFVQGIPEMTDFHKLTGKPVLITEFGFRSRDSGLPNTYPPPLAVQPTVATQQARAERYAKYVNLWMDQPYFVGYHWFRYMDEPKEGRFDGENGNYGLVDIRDDPYTEFVEAAAVVNRGVWSRHRSSGKPAK
ncbi:MAG: beta-agarase [Phycisphaerae bacterium]|nr:beta-agarase [Phycisphaerae bacterium]